MYAGWDILTNQTHLVFAGMSEYSNLWLSYLLDLKHEGKEDLITEDMILTDEQAEAMNELFEMRPEDFPDGQEYAEYKNIAEYNARWNRDQWNELMLKRMISDYLEKLKLPTMEEILKKRHLYLYLLYIRGPILGCKKRVIAPTGRAEQVLQTPLDSRRPQEEELKVGTE